jgi:hypothetical protein
LFLFYTQFDRREAIAEKSQKLFLIIIFLSTANREGKQDFYSIGPSEMVRRWSQMVFSVCFVTNGCSFGARAKKKKNPKKLFFDRGSALRQGCQIFLGTANQKMTKMAPNLPNGNQLHTQNTTKITKLPPNIPNERQIYQMAEKAPTFSTPRPSKMCPNWDFW